MDKYLKTNISVAYWCKREGVAIRFQPAYIPAFIKDRKDNNYFPIKDESKNYVSWFDNLFEGGGIKIPESGGKPTTLLITGPPGSGKTILALELCLRVAISHDFWSLYISTESETQDLIKKVNSFKIEGSREKIFAFDKNIRYDDSDPKNFPKALIIYGQENIKRWETFAEILKIALEDVSNWLLHYRGNLIQKIIYKIFPSPRIPRISPNILVVDSLNMVAPEKRSDFFEKIIKRNYGDTKLIIIILDSHEEDKPHGTWEFACDNIIKLDYSIINLDATSLRDYYIRNIEVVKARNQAHIWGKQQMKIYTSYKLPEDSGEREIDKIYRAHPYRENGGIFIYPSIHLFLSIYKRRAVTQDIETVETPCRELNEMIRGFPIGRCTAFMGCRGGHKSHLGYLHLLERIEKTRDMPKKRKRVL